MGIMLDIIAATVVVGMLVMTIMNVNINMSNENYKGFAEFKTQTEMIQLGRILEFDMYKAGFRIGKSDAITGEQIAIAESSQVKFYTNLFNITGRKDSAEGTLSVSDALRVFAIRTLVAAKYEEANKELISQIVRERRSNFLSTDFIF